MDFNEICELGERANPSYTSVTDYLYETTKSVHCTLNIVIYVK